MINALEDYVILGINSTIDFLKDVIAHPQFQAGNTTTSFIEKHFDGWEGKTKTEDGLNLAMIASAFDRFQKTYASHGTNRGAVKKDVFSPWQSLGKWRLGGRE